MIQDVSVSVADGEFLALAGPSGCGKSTLLRMIADLEAIASGDILIGGEVVNDLAPKDRDIAMVFQSYALSPKLTVKRSIGQPLRPALRPKAEIRERVAEAARILPLTPLLDRHPRQLSGGQRQRVAIGGAIVRDPKAFLFDEPLSNLDAKLRVQMRAEVKELHQRLRTTTIHVTHDQIEAMTVADRIVVMRGGRIRQLGAPLSLHDHARNLFVASFRGSPAINLVEGRFEGQDGGRSFRTSAGPLLSVAPPAGVAPRQSVVLGLRPEHPSLAPPDAAKITAEVVVVELSGADTLLTLRAGGLATAAFLRESCTIWPGGQVGLSIAPGLVHAFDASSGERIGPAGAIPGADGHLLRRTAARA